MNSDNNLQFDYKYGFSMPENYVFKARKGLDEEIVKEISFLKKEPSWMTELRLKAYQAFLKKPMPKWGADLSGIDFNDIYYYIKPTENQKKSWEDLPKEIKETYDKIGVPEAEKNFLAGVSAQYECLTGDTLIFGDFGALPLIDIKPGMNVYCLDMKSRLIKKQKVKALLNKGKKTIYKIKVAGREIRCTENHPFLVIRYKKDPNKKKGRFFIEWEYLKNLSNNDYIAIVKDLPDEGKPYKLPYISFEKEYKGKNQTTSFVFSSSKFYTRKQKKISIPSYTSVDFMWLIGLYYGDGYITKSKKNSSSSEVLSIAIPKTESLIRKKLTKSLEKVFNYKLSQEIDKYRVRIFSQPIISLIKLIGVEGKAYTKTVPQWIFGLPKDQKLALIGGFIDSDGYVRNSSKNCDIYITSVNKKLLDSFQMLAISCGLHVTGVHQFLFKDLKTKKKSKTGYRLQITGDLSLLKDYSIKVKQKFVPRKYYHNYSSYYNKSSLKKYVNNYLGFAKIQDISLAGEENVFDIEVDKEHNFVANGLIVHNSEVVYKSIQKELARQGVIFLDMDSGLREYPEIVKKYFGTVVSLYDNKFASLNSAVWSGGSFVYVPKGVKVSLPLQAYFRINAQNFGQFERTLIIAEEGSYVHYLEGCLPAGEMILTSEGYKNIEAIKPSDLVYTSSGLLSKVKAVMTREYKDYLYEITPISPENKFSLTKEHPVLAIKRNKVLVKRKKRFNWLFEVDTKKLINEKPEYIEAEKLEKGDFLVFPKIKNQLFQDKKTEFSDEMMEIFGFYLAEGSLNYHKKLKQYIVSFSFSKKEKNNYLRVSKLIEKIVNKKANIFINDKKNEARISVYSKDLYDLIFENCGKYSYEKFISQKILDQKKQKLEKLFWAYFKGDGNLSIKNKKSYLYRINTSSKKLAFGIQIILNKIGFFASIGLRKGGKDRILGRNIKRKDQYIVNFTHPKKWSEIRETDDYYLVPIKSIKKKKVEKRVFNLEVEGNNSYLVKGFAVHNCTAPIYTTSSLHAAVVEIIVKKGARVRYTTVQNWSKNVYNLVTKRAKVEEKGIMEWIDCNLGSKVTMKYPACILVGEGAKGEVLSIAYASENQVQDAGAKMIHLAPNTSSRIISKSIAGKGGRTSYRGLVYIAPNASNSSSYVSCDALILDEKSRSDTYPTMKIENKKTYVQHEATVEKLGEEKLFYLQSRGIKKSDAEGLLVNGFIEPVTKEIPLEYTVELNRLINLEMSGSVG